MFTNKYAYLIGAGLICANLVVWGLVAFPAISQLPGLYFLNVGQGDSELVIFPGGEKVLIDGGPSGALLLQNLSKILPAQDRYIDLVMMSHPQTDHFNGFIDLLKHYQVGVFLGSGRLGTSASYQVLREELLETKTGYVSLYEGDMIRAGDAIIKIISPNKQELVSKELNDTSLVALVQAPEYRALYTGDIGANIEERLVREYDLRADILKVGHHGSRFSSSLPFIQELSPDIAVIEVGKNSYGHPTKQALENLSAVAREVLRTDTEGIIKIIPAGGKLLISHLK